MRAQQLLLLLLLLLLSLHVRLHRVLLERLQRRIREAVRLAGLQVGKLRWLPQLAALEVVDPLGHRVPGGLHSGPRWRYHRKSMEFKVE